jgi:outer membrane protein assembly factor BamB
MHPFFFSPFALLLSLAFRLAADENWPDFRGSHGNGHSDAADVPLEWSEQENVRWKTAIHGRGWSSPVVWGERIWMTTATADGKSMYVVCVDRATGKILHDRLLFENEAPRTIHELNSYASPSPVVEQGRVYVHFGSYGTACLDAADGSTVWSRRDLPCDHFRGPGSSPILFENLLIVHFDGADFQYVVALDKQSGKTVWKKDRSNDYETDNGDFKKAYSTPLIIRHQGRLQMISSGSKATTSHDPRTGDELWQVRYKEFSGTARPIYAGGLVLVNTGFGKAEMWAIRPDGSGDVSDTHVAWRAARSIGSKPSPVAVDDLVYTVHDSGVAICMEVATGKTVWTRRLGGNFSASPIVAGGHIYFCNQQGESFILRPGRTFQQVRANQLDAGCMASPAAVGRTLFLRTETSLYRIERAAEE